MYKPKLTRVEADRRVNAVRPFLAMGMSKTQSCEKAGFSISSLMRAEKFIRKSNSRMKQETKDVEFKSNKPSKEMLLNIVTLNTQLTTQILTLLSTM